VSYVGHPLLDEAVPRHPRAAFRARAGITGGDAAADALVALLPGSRATEVRRLFPIQAEAAAAIASRRPGTRFLVAAASAARAREIRAMTSMIPGIDVIEDATDDLLAACDLAIVASGTATVQGAIHGAPMVVMYRVTGLEYAIARRMVRVPHIAMVNLIAGRRVVPELVQEEASAARIASEAVRLLEDDAARERMKRELAAVRESLGGGGAARRAAELVLATALGKGTA
jgi:lipid-A-disaccharide synthase